MWCSIINHIYMGHICAKGVYIRGVLKQLLIKCQFLMKCPQILHTYKSFILFYFILFYFILFYFILFYFILFYFIFTIFGMR